MARPIKETPILYGADAIRFAERAEKVERAENRKQLEERVANAKSYINVCW